MRSGGGRAPSRQVIDVESLDEAARERLADELFGVHERIFSGVDRARFAHKVVHPPARSTRIQVVRDADGRAVGYCAVHRYDLPVAGRRRVVFRAEAGILPAWRGAGATFAFGFGEAIRYKLTHPFARVLFFCTLVHPSSYHLLSRGMHEVYPRPQEPVPPAVEALMRGVADAFGERPLEPAAPQLRAVGWVTLDTPEETVRWHANAEPDVRFFLARNPGYGKGDGLLVLVPLTFRNLVLTAGKHALRRAGRVLRIGRTGTQAADVRRGRG